MPFKKLGTKLNIHRAIKTGTKPMKRPSIANALLEQALDKLDKVGYELGKLGISYKVNRHTAIAIAMTQKTRIESEIERAKIHYDMNKVKINHLTNKIDNGLDEVIEMLPSAIAKPAKRIHRRIHFPKLG